MVANLSIEANQLSIETLPSKTRKAFLAASQLSLFRKHGWYLAGGTALALQVGHRKSVDLDFFTLLGKFPETALVKIITRLT